MVFPFEKKRESEREEEKIELLFFFVSPLLNLINFN